MKRILSITIILLSFLYSGCNNDPDPCNEYDPGSIQLGKVMVRWSPPPEAENYTYIVQLSTNGMTYIDIASTTDTVYVFEEGILDYCNTYRCKIYAVNEYGLMGPSSLPSNKYSPKP